MSRKVITSLPKKEKESLKNHFYKHYLYSSWFFKYKALDSIIQNYDKFLETIAHGEFKEAEKDVVLRSLKSEVFFTFFHMTESLFSLMMAISRKNSNPWIRLRTLERRELNHFVRDIASRKKKFTKNKLMYYFFYGVDLKNMETHIKESIEKSLDFIKEYLVVIAKRYTNRELYNVYKHGMSCIFGKSRFTYEKNGQFTDLGEKDSFIFLSSKFRKKYKVKHYKIEGKFRAFDYDVYLESCKTNHGLIRNMINARKEIVKGIRGAWYITFHEKDITKMQGGLIDDFTGNFKLAGI